jgi:hypothetical protein
MNKTIVGSPYTQCQTAFVMILTLLSPEQEICGNGPAFNFVSGISIKVHFRYSQVGSPEKQLRECEYCTLKSLP